MKERLAIAVAWLLPRRVVYWAAIRLFAYGTAKHPKDGVPAFTCVKALQAW